MADLPQLSGKCLRLRVISTFPSTGRIVLLCTTSTEECFSLFNQKKKTSGRNKQFNCEFRHISEPKLVAILAQAMSSSSAVTAEKSAGCQTTRAAHHGHAFGDRADRKPSAGSNRARSASLPRRRAVGFSARRRRQSASMFVLTLS